jgi:Flp pilus assembly protein TadG
MAAMRATITSRWRRGASTILLVVALPVIVVFAWFVLEYARVARHASKAKAAADAIALAAAARYADGADVARADATAAAGSNNGPNGPLVLLVGGGPGGGGDLEFGTVDPQTRAFTPNTSEGGPAVRATVRFAADHPNGTLQLVMSGLFSVPPVELQRSSIAIYRPPTHTTSLLLGDAGGSTLALSGSAVLRSRGGVSVASADAAAVQAAGTSYLDVPVLRAAGAPDASVAGHVSGAVQAQASIPADPFASTALPTIEDGAGDTIDPGAADVVHVSPGVHNALAASSGTIVLDKGLHQFDGGVSLSGTAVLELADATLQLQGGAALQVTGGAVLRGTCASEAGAWGGYGIIQQSGTAQWTVDGGGTVQLAGRCYAPGAHVVVGGTAVVTLPAALVHSLTLTDAAGVRLTSDIAEVALPVVPGRARLMR